MAIEEREVGVVWRFRKMGECGRMQEEYVGRGWIRKMIIHLFRPRRRLRKAEGGVLHMQTGRKGGRRRRGDVKAERQEGRKAGTQEGRKEERQEDR